MRQSNTYIIVFSAIMTIVIGGLLSFTAVKLKPIQKEQVELDTRKQILGAVMTLQPTDDVLSIYKNRTKSVVINIEGDIVEKDADGKALIAEEVDVAKEYKKNPEDRLFPVFMYMNESNPEKVDSYIVPIYGNGLWDRIWGFVALDTDLNTIKGMALDHKGETPGLGARITSEVVKDRYKAKKIFSAAGDLMGVSMLKGESNPASALDDHHIDGMSGATITGNGVNQMIEAYMGYYKAYFDKLSKDKNS